MFCMKTIVFLFVTVLLPLVSFGQNDSSRYYRKLNYVDYIGKDTIQAFFWNGTIARCPIPSPLFNSLDSVESEVIVVIMYMPMKFQENGELKNKTVRESIQNIQGGEEKMYFLGFDLFNEKLHIYTCEDYLMSIPIRSYRRGSNKLIVKTENDRFLGRYEIQLNRKNSVLGVVYDKTKNLTEILYSTKPELIQIFK
jgi:hypothetical protein